MRYEQILYEVSDHIATITLNRPEKLNAWTMQMSAEVRHAMFQADGDGTVRVIVVTGAGRGYCAGADMDLLQGLQGGRDEPSAPAVDAALAVEFDPTAPAVFRGEYSYPLSLRKPVIAAVNGIAVGLGFSYMLYYDMRIASDRARFGTVFVRRGLIAEHGCAWLLPRLVGMHHACDLLYSGRIVDADEALRIGLVNHVAPHDSLMAVVRARATEMATLCSPRSISVMKRQLYRGMLTDLDAAIQDADTEMMHSFGTEDFREGVGSFVQRRPPRFTGR